MNLQFECCVFGVYGRSDVSCRWRGGPAAIPPGTDLLHNLKTPKPDSMVSLNSGLNRAIVIQSLQPFTLPRANVRLASGQGSASCGRLHDETETHLRFTRGDTDRLDWSGSAQ